MSANSQGNDGLVVCFEENRRIYTTEVFRNDDPAKPVNGSYIQTDNFVDLLRRIIDYHNSCMRVAAEARSSVKSYGGTVEGQYYPEMRGWKLLIPNKLFPGRERSVVEGIVHMHNYIATEPRAEVAETSAKQ